MIDSVKKYKWFIVGSCVIAIGMLIYARGFVNDNEEENKWTIPSEEEQDPEVPEEKFVQEPDVKNLVDVKGAVENPGVYEVMLDERVIDVIEKAGGLKEGADETKINFAGRVTDEMVLYIPLIGEEGENMIVSAGASSTSTSTSQGEGKININKATSDELQNLPGIGPSKADAIIAYREENGLFQTIDDLKLVTGIGDKTFEKLQDQIIVK
ncbi:helix-hairpin-helix domain-containing protein [Robertmurraya sp. P23]|uniref:helix-hairpin-helix domain-containing protein n=1 Tax=Robertmurraya sp. P23 TaxID=3436931 RepID=UPI003D98B65A